MLVNINILINLQVRCPDCDGGFYHGMAYGTGFTTITKTTNSIGGGYYSGTGTTRKYQLSLLTTNTWQRSTADASGTPPATAGAVPQSLHDSLLTPAKIPCCGKYTPIQEPVVVRTGMYRFGFNGQELDNEVTGVTGSHYTAEFWEYDSRLGRRWNLDPKPQISISDYACFGNSPIWYSDILGDIAGDYWKIINNKYVKVGTDNVDDKKNYVLKPDEILTTNITPENVAEHKSKFILLPSYTQRSLVMAHWNKYISNKENELVGTTKYSGTFHEEAGVGTDAGNVYFGEPGKKIVPKTLEENVDLTPKNYGETKVQIPETINLIYHFHATARKSSDPSSGSSYGDVRDYLYNQVPSNKDYNNIQAHLNIMKNGGTILQISHGEGINFLGYNKNDERSILLNMNFKQFNFLFPNEK